MTQDGFPSITENSATLSSWPTIPRTDGRPHGIQAPPLRKIPMQNSHVSPMEAIRTTPWIKKTGLSSVDLEFVANNLFTIDKVKYFDPEQASANGAAYPIPATYTFQVYLKF